MATEEFLISISPQPVEGFENRLTGDARFGADNRFLGVVRGLENGRAITGIDYTCYEPMARRQLKLLAEKMRDAHPDHRVVIHHRTGFVAAGEASIVIRVQTAHSQAAFDLCREYLRRIKTSIPIWKEPIFSDPASPAARS